MMIAEDDMPPQLEFANFNQIEPFQTASYRLFSRVGPEPTDHSLLRIKNVEPGDQDSGLREMAPCRGNRSDADFN